MNIKEYKNRLDSLGIEKEDYIIISGGSMLFHGLKEDTGDIDIKVTPEVFERLKQKFEFKKSPKFDYLYEIYDDVEVAVQPYDESYFEVVDGYRVEKLEIELKWKKEHNREKDIEAIKKIEEYLNNRK